VAIDPGGATAHEAGRSCPYCRFPLKEGAPVARCPVCGSVHHTECWDENGGCAVVACAGGPAATATTMPGAPAETFATAPTAPYAAPPARWAPPRSRTSGWLIVALIVLALAAGGGAVAVVMQQKSNHAQAQSPATVTAVETQTVSAPPPEAPPSPPSPAANGALPSESRAQMTSEIRDLLYQHHEDIVNRDFAAAWSLLTPRKRRQNLEKYGYSTWAANQATLSPYLDPTNIQVRILSLDPATGEATVDVTGMTWSKPGSPCSEWSGITWVKFDGGQWLYDPGYSTTPVREAEWKSRSAELLGVGC